MTEGRQQGISRSGRAGYYPRGEKFLRVRGSYELFATQQGATIPASIAALLARVPPPGTMPAEAYCKAVHDIVTWADIDTLEVALFGILPDGDLVESLRFCRVVYEQSVVEDEFIAYEKTMVDLSAAGQATGPPMARVRAELVATTQRINYVLEHEAPKEVERTRLTALNTSLMVVSIAIIVVLFNVSLEHPSSHLYPTPALFLVLCSGIVGGFISVQQRLQQPTNVDPFLKWIDLRRSGLALLLSPLIGMIFAVVLYSILLSGLLTGPAFPTFRCPVNPLPVESCAAGTIEAFGRAATPADAADWAKLGLWSFVAGFLERLVPDILTRIAATAYVKK